MTASGQGAGTPARTALVVEDYDDTRVMLRLALERKGFRVIEAQDGIAAVAAARRELPELILMDINLPLIDGVNATRRIRETERLQGTIIIAITAYDSLDLRNAAFGQGCNEFIVKPFDLRQLEDLIDRLFPMAHGEWPDNKPETA